MLDWRGVRTDGGLVEQQVTDEKVHILHGEENDTVNTFRDTSTSVGQEFECHS